MCQKFIFGYLLFQAASLFSAEAESESFVFVKTGPVDPLKEEYAFYEAQLRAKALKTQSEKPFDEAYEQTVSAQLTKTLGRFDEFRTNDATGHYLMRIQKGKSNSMVALIVFAFNRKHHEKLVWIGPLAILAGVDQRELWQACKEEARKRGGLTFTPGLNKAALKGRDRLESTSSEELGDYHSEEYPSPKVYGQVMMRKELSTPRCIAAKPVLSPTRARVGSEGSALGLSVRKNLLERRLCRPPFPARSLQAPSGKLGGSGGE